MTNAKFFSFVHNEFKCFANSNETKIIWWRRRIYNVCVNIYKWICTLHRLNCWLSGKRGSSAELGSIFLNWNNVFAICQINRTKRNETKQTKKHFIFCLNMTMTSFSCLPILLSFFFFAYQMRIHAVIVFILFAAEKYYIM